MSTSFPFLKIARETGTPYPIIIRLAERLEAFIDTNFRPVALTRTEMAVVEALLGERNRRQMFEVERVLRERRHEQFEQRYGR